ncbi:hypothetical protein C8R43DRAFT_942570 [Mycena crocata]|nr:hypothetical protein C8R43DRAFT_942570 [Mycena crocata]
MRSVVGVLFILPDWQAVESARRRPLDWGGSHYSSETGKYGGPFRDPEACYEFSISVVFPYPIGVLRLIFHSLHVLRACFTLHKKKLFAFPYKTYNLRITINSGSVKGQGQLHPERIRDTARHHPTVANYGSTDLVLFSGLNFCIVYSYSTPPPSPPSSRASSNRPRSATDSTDRPPSATPIPTRTGPTSPTTQATARPRYLTGGNQRRFLGLGKGEKEKEKDAALRERQRIKDAERGALNTLQLQRIPSRLSGWLTHLAGSASDLSLTSTRIGSLSHGVSTEAALAGGTRRSASISAADKSSHAEKGGSEKSTSTSSGRSGAKTSLLDKVVRYLLDGLVDGGEAARLGKGGRGEGLCSAFAPVSVLTRPPFTCQVYIARTHPLQH